MKHRLNTLILAINITWICIFLHDHPGFYYFLGLAFLLFLVYMSLGVLFMQFNYFLPALTRLNSEYCVLSFDDGPDPATTPLILDTLKKHNIAALFFVIGEKAEQHPDLVRNVQEDGHLLGNHSYAHHKFMSLQTRDTLRKDIGKAQEVLERITGRRTHLFRPPIGYTNPRFATVLREQSLLCVGWTLRSYDSVYRDPEKLAGRLTSGIRPGMIVLLHDNLQVGAEALDKFIVESRKNGIKFASPANIKQVLHA